MAYINGRSLENNPVITVMLGDSSTYLQSSCLETVSLRCRTGALQVYFDQVELSPEGAVVMVDCKLGSVELYVPNHWRIVNHASCLLGAIEVTNSKVEPGENPPTLLLTGKVSFGALEVFRLRGQEPQDYEETQDISENPYS
ncbi:MAG: cell wall-active antibiotics response protein [Oscillospiraceae bacterium]|nr:cell wall-active antibiotics response protein [Oscillospiraceae bacterium]